ncbi:hypothetical protein C8J57DRAFT_665929 [Mycena rebaudengoi]|nr:hypothetical protein C8J57DRAFT_665929 [Mycena rebaudengoi]
MMTKPLMMLVCVDALWPHVWLHRSSFSSDFSSACSLPTPTVHLVSFKSIRSITESGTFNELASHRKSRMSWLIDKPRSCGIAGR